MREDTTCTLYVKPVVGVGLLRNSWIQVEEKHCDNFEYKLHIGVVCCF